MENFELIQKIEEQEKQINAMSLWQQDVNKLLSRILQMIGDQNSKLQENEEGIHPVGPSNL